jgi:hypothetical protein
MTTASQMYAAPIDDELGFAYGLSVVAGMLLFVASLSGLIFATHGLYDPDPATLPAFYAQDAMTLAGWAAPRESDGVGPNAARRDSTRATMGSPRRSRPDTRLRDHRDRRPLVHHTFPPGHPRSSGRMT